MNGLARLGFLLIGVSGLVDAFLMIAEISAEANMWSAPLSETLLSGVVLALVLFTFGLPLLLLVFCGRLADLVFPPERGQLSKIDAHALMSAGVCVLGVYIAVMGVSGLASGLGSLAFAGDIHDNPGITRAISSQIFSGLALLALGVLLYFFGPRLAYRVLGKHAV